MARIHDLVNQIKNYDSGLADEISKEVSALSNRREFGLNFERHTPEQVELPGRPVRKGDKVHILAPRGGTSKAENKVMWVVVAIDRDTQMATLRPHRGEGENRQVEIGELVVVAEFRDPIYPGLISTGKVERGGDKPYHTVINAENFHALEALLFTHSSKFDVVYIDPPYNTGARDWKYNNDYVEAEDSYRHSKWLAFMERRLLLSKELLNPEDSVLIVTIDEKEYLRLGLLLEQIFPEARIQMISSVIKPGGVARASAFSRSDEYIFFVMNGKAAPTPLELGLDWTGNKKGKTTRGKVHWNQLYRRGADGVRSNSPGCYFPIYVRNETHGATITRIGDALPLGKSPQLTTEADGSVAVFPPMRPNGADGRWSTTPENLRELLKQGFVRPGKFNGANTPMYFLSKAEREKATTGEYKFKGLDQAGVAILDDSEAPTAFIPSTQWNISTHDASRHGSNLLSEILPGRHFPYPKSLYAVEDALRFFVAKKPDATVLDFFAGSGTTAHALMRLNQEDNGNRVSISITNNEVSDKENKELVKKGLRPGDPEWEAFGICDYITKPRIQSAITGLTPSGHEIKGAYKSSPEFEVSEGLNANVNFFTMTYETPLEIISDRVFGRIAPLLWLKSGCNGEVIMNADDGWAVNSRYGILKDLDKTAQFVDTFNQNADLTHAFIFTDEDRLFESIVQALPPHVVTTRMYEGFIRNFELEAMAVTR